MTNTAERVWSLDIGFPDWLSIPRGARDIDWWRPAVTLAFETLSEADHQLRDPLSESGTVIGVDEAIDTLLDFAESLPADQRLVAALGLPDRWPLPVVVAVTAVEDEPQDLLAAAGARGGRPIELPLVDYLPDELGDGIRVTRFDLDDEGAVWATVCCARRADDVDTILTWRTNKLDLVPRFSPVLESLLGAVRIGSAA